MTTDRRKKLISIFKVPVIIIVAIIVILFCMAQLHSIIYRVIQSDVDISEQSRNNRLIYSQEAFNENSESLYGRRGYLQYGKFI